MIYDVLESELVFVFRKTVVYVEHNFNPCSEECSKKIFAWMCKLSVFTRVVLLIASLRTEIFLYSLPRDFCFRLIL
jgi:hypothetical protein